MKNRTLHISLIFIIFMLSGCADQEWTEPFPDRLNIFVLDSIGIETGDPCYVLGSIVATATAPDGNILMLDQSACIIRVFDSDGIHIENLSRQGSGPGELLMPWEMAVFPDGKIMVMDLMKGGMIILDSCGKSISELTEWPLAPPCAIAGIGNNQFAGCAFDAEMQASGILFKLHTSLFSTENAETEQVIHTDSLVMDLENTPLSPTGMLEYVSITTNIDRRIFYNLQSTEEYLVYAWDHEGNELFTASLEIPPVEKTRDELVEETEYTRMRFASMGMNTLPEGSEPDPNHIFVVGLGADINGNLWIQRGTEEIPVFDVFDTSGTHIATAEFPRNGRHWCFSITPYGNLTWNLDPESGYQTVYLLELPEISGNCVQQ